ncbi:MAG: RagB/SusD family nutrient uptake outer membrane protein [Salinibacter sp.]
MTDGRTVRYSAAIGAVVLLAFGVVLSACDLMNGEFLDRGARGAVSEEVLANSNGGVNALLNSAYGALTAVAESGAALGGGLAWESAQDNWVYGSVAGGEAYKGSIGGDQAAILTIAKMQHDPSVGYFNTKWKTLYEGVSRANNVLAVLPKSDKVANPKQVEAEARFLRAHFYFDLKRNFGQVPWVDQNTENPNQPNTGENHPNVWTKIEADLKFAKKNLPGTPSEVGRAYKWAARAYLGKVYLYQEKWQKALTELEGVIDNGTNANGTAFQLTPAYQDMFNPATENNSGTVFAVQNTGSDGSGGIGNSRGGAVLNYPHGGQSPFGCCGFYQPSQWFVNSFRTGSDGLPTLDRAAGTSVKNDQGVEANEKYSLGTQTLDPRLEWSVGRRGVPYHDWGPHPGDLWIRDQAVGGPYAPKKHVYRRSQEDTYGATNSWGATGSAVNYKIIRFADVLLMAAEAKAELTQGDLGLSYVNRVRDRAGNSESKITYDMNKEFALKTVNSESAMLSTSPEQYDWVVREDRQSTFVFLGGDPGNSDNWNEYVLPDYNVEPYGSFGGKKDALKKIRFERMLELGMEGHRFYDLARWGTADQQLQDYYDFETSDAGPNNFAKSNLTGGDFTTDKNAVFPIPQRQIDLSVTGDGPMLEQNPGYK